MDKPQSIPLNDSPRHKKVKLSPLPPLENQNLDMETDENYSKNNSQSIQELEAYETD